MAIWLQSVGTHSERLDPDWIRNGDELLGSVWTTKHPNQWAIGDIVVYYASGHGSIVAIVEIEGEAAGGEGGRWQWRTAVRPVVVLDVEAAPLLEGAGLRPVRDYKRLTATEYNRICDLVSDALKFPPEDML